MIVGNRIGQNPVNFLLLSFGFGPLNQLFGFHSKADEGLLFPFMITKPGQDIGRAVEGDRGLLVLLLYFLTGLFRRRKIGYGCGHDNDISISMLFYFLKKFSG